MRIKPFATRIFAGMTIFVMLGSLAFTIRRRPRSRYQSDTNDSSHRDPRLILWAWERPTDLSFINPDKVAVAFLAKTIILKSDEILVRPRLQPLRIPQDTTTVAVARVEIDRKAKPELTEEQCEKSASAIAEMASLPGISAIQIDFDATRSEREFYRQLIVDVRHRLPVNTRLSITALASWCMDDEWISDLPIDEAVPMLFRMAGDGKQIVNRLNAGEDFHSTPCRNSYGIALDEARPHTQVTRTLYAFNPDAWTEQSVREIMESR